MTNLAPTPSLDDVFQLEIDTPVLGGPGGIANTQAQALLNRTAFLDKYTPSPFRSGRIYGENERVLLTSGDIVKSTVPDNTTDPNVDMTGWAFYLSASAIKDANGLNQQFINDSSMIKSPQYFGAKGGDIDDQEVFTNLNAGHIYALGVKYTCPVYRSPIKKVIGNNTDILVDSVNGDTTVCVQIPENSHYSDIDFINNPTQQKSWTYAVIGSNSTLTNVGFYNFDDNVLPKNSWGIYFENKDNIVLNSPKFGGNGVSDIAILDNVKNITIINAKNTADAGGVTLDIEPNGVGNIENINVIGGEYASIHVLENSFLSQGIKSLNITGAKIKLLELRGGQTNITGGRVDRIKGNWANTPDYSGMQNEFFCSLKVDNVNLSLNMIKDSHLFSLSNIAADSYWSIYAPDGASVGRVSDSFGDYLSINKDRVGYHIIGTRNFEELPVGAKSVCVVLNYSILNNSTDVMFEPCIFEFYDASNQLIVREYSIKGGRVPAGNSFPWGTELAIFDVPENAVKFKISLRCNKNSSVLNIKEVGVHALSISTGMGNFNDIIASYNQNKDMKIYKTLSYNTVVGSGLSTPKTAKFDVIVPSAKLGQAVSVSCDSRLSEDVIITGLVAAPDVVRLNVTNFGDAINRTVNFNIRVDYT